MCNARHGFSVLELVVVLALVGILAAIALPGWSRLLPSYQLDGSVRQVQSELHGIKMRAVSVNTAFQLAYLADSTQYMIQSEGKVLATKPLPEGIVITKAGSISFSPRGTAGGERVRLRSSTGLCKQVVVSQTGRVRVCKPNACSDNC
jgi:prepilin-type N-terminal cleavage/methylation domain-containing protein